MDNTEAAAKLAVLQRAVDDLRAQIVDLRAQLLEDEIYILPLKFSQVDLYRNAHVHNRAGVCVKNRYGVRCEGL